jgi:hypothetical protein
MQNGSRKMIDSRYTSIYGKKDSYTLNREQLSAETCRNVPADRRAESAKPISNAGKGKL